MSERLQKVERKPSALDKLDLTNADLIEVVTNNLLPFSSQLYQARFKQLNKQFFNNELPPCLIVDFTCTLSDAGGFYHQVNCFTGFISIRGNTSNYYEKELIFLHEMQHYYNHLYNIKEDDHGLGWAKSLQHILDKLNIDFKATDLTDSELRSFPSGFFNNYDLNKYFTELSHLILDDMT